MLGTIVIVQTANSEQKRYQFEDQNVWGRQMCDKDGYRFCLFVDGAEVAHQRFSGIEAFEKISLNEMFDEWQA